LPHTHPGRMPDRIDPPRRDRLERPDDSTQ
jgi:hypothetical protein